MTDHRLLDALLRDADSVPNPADPPSGSWTSDIALLEIERRRTTLRTRQEPSQPDQARPARRRRGVLIAVAAFAAVLLVVGVVAALTSSGGEVVGTTTSIESAPTTTLDPTEAAWEAIPAFDSAGGFGDFRSTTFAVPFSFDTGSVHFYLKFEHEDWLSITNPLGTILAIDVVVVTDSIEETVRAFNEVHNFYPDAQMTDPVPATIGGAEGVMFETTGLPIVMPDDADHPFITPPDVAKTPMVGAGGGAVFIVDVDGQIIVVGYGGVDTERIGQETGVIEGARRAARRLVDSIVWKNLS